MTNLLKLEFRKLFRQKKLYVCIVVIIAMLVIVGLTNNAVSNVTQSQGLPIGPTVGGEFLIAAPDNVSFMLIAGIFAVLVVCEDFEMRTIKNIYARGYSRRSVFLSKVISVAVASAIMYLALIATSVVLCAVFFNFSGFNDPTLYAALAVKFIVILANVMLSVLISFIFCKNGIAIAATVFAPMVVELLLALANIKIKGDFYLPDYWISSAGSNLNSLVLSVKDLVVPFAVSAVYIVVLVIAGKIVCDKNEV